MVDARSTKAGPAGPATHGDGRGVGIRRRRRSLNEGRPCRAGNACSSRKRYGPTVEPDLLRSTKAGPAGPATRELSGGHGQVARLTRAQRRPALPGRQRFKRGVGGSDVDRRSTKAGPAGPATPSGVDYTYRAVARSTKAGPAGPATPGQEGVGADRDHARSTKAGPAGPATLNCGRSSSRRPISAQRRPALPGRQRIRTGGQEVAGREIRPLNEGRPCRAGNARSLRHVR